MGFLIFRFQPNTAVSSANLMRMLDQDRQAVKGELWIWKRAKDTTLIDTWGAKGQGGEYLVTYPEGFRSVVQKVRVLGRGKGGVIDKFIFIEFNEVQLIRQVADDWQSTGIMVWCYLSNI